MSPSKFIFRALTWSIIATVTLGLGYCAFKYVAISRFNDRVDQVKSGDSTDDVVALLGTPDSVRRRSDGNLISLEPIIDSTDIQYIYFIDTFFLPIGWVVEFNADSRVIRTFRLD